MKFNKIDLKLIEAYVVLFDSKKIKIENIPEKYQEQVKIKSAERIIEILSEEEI